MMTELETYYREVACNSTTWAHPDADVCGCRGGGWWLSEVDTLHRCGYHYDGQPTNDDPDEVWDAYYTGKAREAYKAIASKACDEFARVGLNAARFNRLAREALGEDDSPEAWVEAARFVAEAYAETCGDEHHR